MQSLRRPLAVNINCFFRNSFLDLKQDKNPDLIKTATFQPRNVNNKAPCMKVTCAQYVTVAYIMRGVFFMSLCCWM